MWGCFRKLFFACECYGVFPTHVGVFLAEGLHEDAVTRLPHACGGVSVSVLDMLKRYFVFPTHVGVFLRRAVWSSEDTGLPHACGGVSYPCRLS